MRDTEWNDKTSGIAPGTPLDVERFFKLDILEPAAGAGLPLDQPTDRRRRGRLSSAQWRPLPDVLLQLRVHLR